MVNKIYYLLKKKKKEKKRRDYNYIPFALIFSSLLLLYGNYVSINGIHSFSLNAGHRIQLIRGHLIGGVKKLKDRKVGR